MDCVGTSHVRAFREQDCVSPSIPNDGRAAMRWCVSIGAVLVAGAMAGGDVAGFAAPNPQMSPGILSAPQPVPRFADKETASSVDVELILAVDVSYSMDMDELA